MPHTDVSLSEVHRTVSIPKGVGLFKRMFAFMGPAYLISVGYMDPGNWATDIEGGARFGYQLLWVLVMSNAMAILLQTLSARLGIVAGRDLAQACRDSFSKPIAIALWILTEIAIAACDLAEVLGTAIGLNLLFGLNLIYGVIITGFDSVLLLAIQSLGVRKFEAFILSLITIIGLCFIFELFLSKPDVSGMFTGFVPFLTKDSLYVAIGIIGATVMPHNLYLHSSLVQTREFEQSAGGKKQACKYNLIDSVVALNVALFINGAILVLAASAFFTRGIQVTELQQAHQLVSPLLGTTLAGVAFALALLLAGQSSTLTGTLAGQIVMEGFLHFKMRPILRRFITRTIAIIPAVFVIVGKGTHGTYDLLILSQVILSIQLPFAVIPLIHFTSDRQRMGGFANKLWVKLLAWLTAFIIVGLNISLIVSNVQSWIQTTENPTWIYLVVGVFGGSLSVLLLYVTIKPLINFPVRELVPHWLRRPIVIAAEEEFALELPEYKRIGVALANSEDDRVVLNHAVSMAKMYKASMCFFHIVEGASGQVYGPSARDEEARDDEQYLAHIVESLRPHKISAEYFLGYGHVIKELIRLVNEQKVDVLVMAGHGHRGITDILFGSTIDPVRHELKIPVVIVR